MANVCRKVFNIACILLLPAQLLADEVIMYNDKPPSAEEMGNILFSSPATVPLEQTAPVSIKSRSISFGNKAAQLPAPPIVDEVASSSIGLPIQFSYNSAKILEKSVPFLNEVGKMMNLENYHKEKLLIEGHTDSSGSARYNKVLSEKRAQAVKSYLVDNYQIPSENLFVSGRGEETPLPNTAPNAANNRRVQFYKAE